MFKTLSISDIYNFYGLILLEDTDGVSPEDKSKYEIEIRLIRDKFITALKSRIIAEAGYIGIDLKNASIEAMVGRIKTKLNEEIVNNASKMAAFGTGFKLMDFVQNMEGIKQPDPIYNASDAFRSTKGKSRSMYGGEPWAKISEAFINVEKAKPTREIIGAIDHLCDLQHNTNYVLFDITSGGNIREVLDMKLKDDSLKYFIKNMTPEFKELATKYLSTKKG